MDCKTDAGKGRTTPKPTPSPTRRLIDARLDSLSQQDLVHILRIVSAYANRDSEQKEQA